MDSIATSFSMRLKRWVCSLVSASVALTPLAAPSPAMAQAHACSGFTAKSGADPLCAAETVGGVPVAYPKLNWTKVSEVAKAAEPGSPLVVGGDEAVNTANRVALVLGLSASDVANSTNLFPANVPYAFARYNPMEATLRVDLFKLEKVGVGSNQVAGLYHAAFTPAHGDHWKAQRAYLHPDTFKTGVTPGVNPFLTFQQAGSDLFHNISLEGAQVAMGHAMRRAGAPLGLLSVADTRLSQVTKKSGGVFKKTVRTWVYGHAKSKWYIAQPADTLNRSTTLQFAAFCAPDPAQETCARYETAVSGVAFEEFDGGTLSDQEDKWEVDFQKKSGLGFLGALVLGVLGSFALASIMSAAGIGGLLGGTSGVVGAGAAAPAMGTFGSFLVSSGAVSGFTSLAATIAVEAAYVAASMAVIGGANLGSVINTDAGVLLGSVNVAKGFYDPAELSKYDAKLNTHVAPKMTGDFHTEDSQGATLSGFRETVLGTCDASNPLANCGVGASGIIPRADQYTETNQVKHVKEYHSGFVRDNDTRPGQAHP